MVTVLVWRIMVTDYIYMVAEMAGVTFIKNMACLEA